jgi:flagellar basal-body rod protein FlgB
VRAEVWSVELSDVTQQALGAALRGAQARHQALAGNIANATTPGYVRQDVEFHSALESAIAAGRKPAELVFTPTRDAAAGPMRADGSTVDVDAESARLAANALEHQALVAVKEARGAAVKAALGVG